MKNKAVVKIMVDIGMTVILMLLMAFEMIGREAHEWLGIGMLILFCIHHILNRKWSQNLLQGKYTPFRICQTILAVLALVSMLASMISGIVMSRYAFAFLNIQGGRSWARTLHMLGAYWGFVFLSLHLGIHWNMMMGRAGRMFPQKSAARTWALRIAGLLIAGYGVYAFIRRDIGIYMLLRSMFVYFDFQESLFFFFMDYLAVMGLFVWAGHYLAVLLRKLSKKRA